MRNIQRTIDEVRGLRGDLSSYLIHLTRNGIVQNGPLTNSFTAKQSLERILSLDQIDPLKSVGQFAHSAYSRYVSPNDLKAVCLTETPLSEIFLFMGIKKRALDFQSYGLVFDAETLSLAPLRAAPVLYFSQPASTDFFFVDQFKKMVTLHYQDFKDIVYLFDRLGKHSGGNFSQDYNFRWEREWRIKGSFRGVRAHVKFGLCPESEIDYFEKTYPPIKFVDPMFHPQQIKDVLKDKGIIL